MAAPELVRLASHDVTLLGDPNRPGGVTFAFTERGGGVSQDGYSSLNLGDHVGDDLACVQENRRRALNALGAGAHEARLVNPNQVHGDHVVVVGGAGLDAQSARQQVREGCDAVVCVEPDVPVLLCFADCVPVVLAVTGGFAVVHCGWKGTIARLASKALRILCKETSADPRDVLAYIGPHIGVEDYEVSAELAERFAHEFGREVLGEDPRHLDLGAAVTADLVEAGVEAQSIACVEESTASHTDRFFSYRAQAGECGRHGALAFLPSRARNER